MNRYERITAALNDKKPDTVPIMLHNFMMAAHEYGVTMKQFRNDPQVIADSFISSVEKYKFDGIMIDVDTKTLAGAVGVPVDFPEDQPARTHQGCLDNLELPVTHNRLCIDNHHLLNNDLSSDLILFIKATTKAWL